jgi:hypothetical protein
MFDAVSPATMKTRVWAGVKRLRIGSSVLTGFTGLLQARFTLLWCRRRISQRIGEP